MNEEVITNEQEQDNLENDLSEVEGEEGQEVYSGSEIISSEPSEEGSEEVSESDYITIDEFNTTMEKVIELQEVQVEGIQYMYSSQLFCVSVLAVLLVVVVLHKIIKIFM